MKRENEREKNIVFFGNGSFKSGGYGYESVPRKWPVYYLSITGLTFILDEFRTSNNILAVVMIRLIEAKLMIKIGFDTVQVNAKTIQKAVFYQMVLLKKRATEMILHVSTWHCVLILQLCTIKDHNFYVALKRKPLKMILIK